jgi:hypothetical protein
MPGDWKALQIRPGRIAIHEADNALVAVLSKGASRNAGWHIIEWGGKETVHESRQFESPEDAAQWLWDWSHGPVEKRKSVPHNWVAEKTGYTESGVWRMRQPGDREPTLDRMRRLESVFGWELCDQINLGPGEWVTEFERVIKEAYDNEQ